MKKLLLVLLLGTLLLSCTDNNRARNFGGEETLFLPKNCKFINSTWKKNDLWIVVQDTTTKQYFMYEKSAYGILEGKIVFK